MFFLIVVAIVIGNTIAQISSVDNIHRQPSRIHVTDAIESCCMSVHHGTSTDLMSCTNRSVSSYFKSVYSSIPYNTQKEGPRFVVTLLTRATPEIFGYASYSYFLQAAYANHNGYALLPLLPDSVRPDYERFRKLVPLSDALKGIAADCDYLVWMDAGICQLVSFSRIP